jgi:hypothetical protein
MREYAEKHDAHTYFLQPSSMNVLALTILISSCLGGMFIVCFALEVRRARKSSPERDSLLPLENPSATRKS